MRRLLYANKMTNDKQSGEKTNDFVDINDTLSPTPRLTFSRRRLWKTANRAEIRYPVRNDNGQNKKIFPVFHVYGGLNDNFFLSNATNVFDRTKAKCTMGRSRTLEVGDRNQLSYISSTYAPETVFTSQ